MQHHHAAVRHRALVLLPSASSVGLSASTSTHHYQHRPAQLWYRRQHGR